MLRTIAFPALLFAGQASSQGIESMQRAQELGTVLASEAACELTLNDAGIEAWIAKNVAADDLGFASNLMLMTQGTEFQMANQTGAARTAHCAAVRRTAKNMGLID